MSDRIIQEDLLQATINYIGAGSISRSMAFIELQEMLKKLQTLKPVAGANGGAVILQDIPDENKVEVTGGGGPK